MRRAVWYVLALLAALFMLSLGLSTAGALLVGSPFAQITHRLTFGLTADPTGLRFWSWFFGDFNGTTFGFKSPMLGVLLLAGVMFFSIWRAQAITARLRRRDRRNDER